MHTNIMEASLATCTSSFNPCSPNQDREKWFFPWDFLSLPDTGSTARQGHLIPGEALDLFEENAVPY